MHDVLNDRISFARLVFSAGQWHLLPGDDQKLLMSSDASPAGGNAAARQAAHGVVRGSFGSAHDERDRRLALRGFHRAVSAGRPDHALPIKGDSREADAIMKAYLDYVGVAPS